MAGEMAAAVRELANAEVVAFTGVGLVARVLPVTEAYRTVEAVLPEGAEEVRPHLAWLLANGSAAGKAYAATLLATFDPEAARGAWESLSHEAAEFTTFHGCVMDRTTLGRYASAQLTVA
jgi:hypothetical protein